MKKNQLLKRLTAILLASLMLVVFVSCGGEEGLSAKETGREELSAETAKTQETEERTDASDTEEKSVSPETGTAEPEQTDETADLSREDGTAERKDPKEEDTTPENGPDSEETSSAPEQGPDEVANPDGLAAFFENRLTVDPGKTHSYLNVREEPSEESKILAILYPNEVVTYVDKEDEWYKVQLNGFTGYVSEEYVLTDAEAYEASRHNIGYACMIREFDTVLYEVPDTSTPGHRLADKADVFAVSGLTGEFFQIDVVSDTLDHLYVHWDKAVLFYQFLGPNVRNGLDEGTEAYLDSLNLGDYQTVLDTLSREAEEEKPIREAERSAWEQASREAEESAAASLEESIRESEEASYAASVEASQAAEWASVSEAEASYLAAIEQAAQEEAMRRSLEAAQEAYRRSVEESSAAFAAWQQSSREQEAAAREAASRSAEEARIASEQASLASSQSWQNSLIDQAKAAENARRAFTAQRGLMTSANVQRSGAYSVNLDQGVIDYTINLCTSYGLDPAIIFSVMYHESRFHTNSVNKSALGTYGVEGISYGLMQVIPMWNKARMAANNVSYPDGLYDPYNNILIGVLILVDHGAQNDWVTALAKFRIGLNDTGYDYARSVLSLAGNFDTRR